jgi:hypothetical protein
LECRECKLEEDGGMKWRFGEGREERKVRDRQEEKLYGFG